MNTPGLDRLAARQNAPLGTYNALRRPSPVASQYQRQSEMYGQALRNLSRDARRGDAKAAIAAIGIRDKANEDGYAPGSILDSDAIQRDIGQREQDRGSITAALDRRTLGLSGSGAATTPASKFEGNGKWYDTQTGGVTGDTAPTRLSAALDMTEGHANAGKGGIDLLNKGRAAAIRLGVENPDKILGGDRNLLFRRTLDSALGNAKTPEEIAALKERGIKNGVEASAFDRRAKWWDTNRR